MRPAIPLLSALGGWLLLGLGASLSPALVLPWQAVGVFLLLSAGLDAWRARRLPTPAVTRQVPGSLALGVWSEVSLELRNPSARNYRLRVFDHHPPHHETRGLPQTVRLAPRSGLTLRYRLRPTQRGSACFSGVHLLLDSPLGLWQHHRYLALEGSTRVYPNFAALTKYALLATENRLGQIGIRKLQRRGEGLEFHQLREYRTGDSLRQLDWNATSRQKKLISKEYQDERDQQVVFLLDCGRRMLAQDGELSHFDYTLNAVLLLSYVALRQGDALGLLSFSGESRWLAPRKGAGVINLVLNQLYDLEPSLRPSDYLHAAQQLMLRQKRRALVVLISNLRDEESEELLPALRLLRKKHLVLVVSLQEKILNQVLEQPVHDFDAALRYAATEDYLRRRRQAHTDLQAHGILCLDTEPEQLPVHLVNRYLEIKRSGRL